MSITRPNISRCSATVVLSPIAELGAYVSRHNDKDRNRTFDLRGAVDEFQTRRAVFEPLEDATDPAYQELAKSLGQEWSELTWSDHLNRTWDRLGHGVCEIILSYRVQLKVLSEDCRQQLLELARLGNSFAEKCIEETRPERAACLSRCGRSTKGHILFGWAWGAASIMSPIASANRAKLGVTDGERTMKALKGIEGKRLTYRPANTTSHAQAEG